LVDGGSSLCPNYLNRTADAAWDTATGSTPWYNLCTAASAAAPIPTLSQWGMIVLSILLVGAAVFGLRRQRLQNQRSAQFPCPRPLQLRRPESH